MLKTSEAEIQTAPREEHAQREPRTVPLDNFLSMRSKKCVILRFTMNVIIV
jgi:hypothetical protein